MAYPAGIDVSKWQPTTPSLTGLAFLIARASIGTTPDAMYATHIAKAKAAGLLTGAYHFNWDEDADPSTPDATPEEQARFFVAKAGDVDFLFLDVEGERAFEPAESDRFIAEVHRLGRRCGLYMSASVYQWNVGQDYDWIAKWGSAAPGGSWEFWQWQGSPLDKDYFNGTLDQLRALAGSGSMGITITEINAEDWRPTGGTRRPIRATPDRTSGTIVGYVEAGEIIRTVVEGKSPDGNVWRVTERTQDPGYLLRSDFDPLVQGGDPALHAQFDAFMARTPPDDCSDEVAEAVAPLNTQISELQRQLVAAAAAKEAAVKAAIETTKQSARVGVIFDD